MYDALFEPFTINGLTLPNRIVMAPMTRGFSPNGVPGKNVADYYRARAAGGVGLIVTEGTTINHPSASDSPNYPNFHTPEALAGWKEVAASVHDAGGFIMPQLWHMGSMRDPGTGPNPDAPSVSASGLKHPSKQNAETLSVGDIAKLVDAYADAAYQARVLGFDGVQVHGAHGYLIDQFFWDGTNLRDDVYGGDLVARTRFATEIVAAIRKAVGNDYPILFRFSQWKQQDFTHKMAPTTDMLKAFIDALEAAGVDCFDCSTRRFHEPEFDGSPLNLAGWTKKLGTVPTITVGSIGLDSEFVAAFQGEGSNIAPIDTLVEKLEAGEFDLVGVGRALLVDPTWPTKIREGRLDDLVPYTKDALANLVI